MSMADEKKGLAGMDLFPGGVVLISRDGEERILAVNAYACEMYQCASKEEFFAFSERQYCSLVVPDDYVPLADLYARRTQDTVAPLWVYHFQMRTKIGDFRWLEGVLGPVDVPGFGKAWSLHLIYSRIRDAAIESDAVTGLMGWHTFYQRVAEATVRNAKNGTIEDYVPVYLNLTNFKMYNANHGVKEGDALLRNVASLLHRCFPDTLMCHLSADNFLMFAAREGIEKKLTALERAFRAQNADPSVSMKAGITLFERLSEEGRRDPRWTFDMAKIAADSIKQDSSRVYASYSEDMGRRLQEESYVLRHFEKAIEKGDIKVYYQPVVRTLTGKIASIEALARWEDPKQGMLMPNVFIPVLERMRLITKLDFYVVEEAAKLLRFQMENQRPVLPVSVNLSRVDFDLCDPVEKVEEIVGRYELPRDLLRIEITETALALGAKKLQQAIRRFHEAGYACWLDDFGSGYSSLNMLHHFSFDEIKFDMSFQRNSNEESRKILRALVLMAKNLGIHTLAEGVETEEQAAFLRSIGCEMIQGYLYGKPMPYEACHRHCCEQQLLSEERPEALAMEKAGLTNLLTDVPLAVFCYDGEKRLAELWRNKAYVKTILPVVRSDFHREGQFIDLSVSPFLSQFKEMLDRAVRSGKEESLTYVKDGQYMWVKVRILAGSPGVYTGRTEFYNITFDDSLRHTRRIEKVSKYLLPVYDSVYLYHGNRGELELLSERQASDQESKRLSIRAWMTEQKRIHPADQPRLAQWAAPRTLCRQIQESAHGVVTGLFRMQQEDGSYRWKEFHALPTDGEADDILLGIKNAALEQVKDRREILTEFLRSFGLRAVLPAVPQAIQQGTIVDALKSSQDIKFFWKDRQRRFLGVSQGFLNYFGIHDEATILGKTDEEMGWHVDAHPYQSIEEEILREGKVSRGAIGKCIIRGRIHTIRASKIPLYEDDRIIGLIGYFEDLDQEKKIRQKDVDLGLIDLDTGLAGFRGMLVAGIEYFNNYERRQEDFIGILFHIPELTTIYRRYGEQFRKELLHKISRIFMEQCSFGETLGHFSNGRFLLYMKYRRSADLDGLVLHLSNRIHAIREIHGRPITLYLQSAVAYGSEAGSMNGLIQLLSERLYEAERQRYGQSIFVGDRIAIDREAFDTSDQNVMMSRLDNDELIYVNKAGLKDLGLPETYDYSGKKCYELLCDMDQPCEECPKKLLRRDRFYTRTYHNRALGRDYLINQVLVPWRGRLCQLEIATNMRNYLSDEMRKNDVFFREMAVNDAIEAGLVEKNPSRGIQNMLGCVGEILECERACIYEEQPDGTVKNTYEWCRDGISSMQAKCQKVSRENVQYLYDSFGTNQIAIINNVQQILDRYGITRTRSKEVKSIISGHLIFGGDSIGFTEIINPSEKILQEASPLLATMTRFLAILINNRNNMNSLNQMSYMDVMTGTRNRRAFLHCVKDLPPDREMTFVFGDMNGLKYINDHFGHKAGDEAICKAADIMKAMAGDDNVFRMGGDEFILVLSDTDAEKGQAFIERMKAAFKKDGISMALGAATKRTPIPDVDLLITVADGEMYKDKKKPRT